MLKLYYFYTFKSRCDFRNLHSDLIGINCFKTFSLGDFQENENVSIHTFA